MRLPIQRKPALRDERAAERQTSTRHAVHASQSGLGGFETPFPGGRRIPGFPSRRCRICMPTRCFYFRGRRICFAQRCFTIPC